MARFGRVGGEVNTVRSWSRLQDLYHRAVFGRNRELCTEGMESALLTRVFRQLLSHQTCSRLRYYPSLRGVTFNGVQKRDYRSAKDDNSLDDFDARRESDWQQRTEILPPDKMKEFEKYPMVTADQLKSRRERPKRVKMLARDFIEGDFLFLFYSFVIGSH